MTEQQIIETDPYNKNLGKKFLSGVKISFNSSCPAASSGSGDISQISPFDASTNTRRSHSAQICSYYTDDTKRQVTAVAHDINKLRFNWSGAPANEKAWVSDVAEYHETCPGDHNDYKWLRFNQAKFDANKGEPIHSVFVATDKCPPYAEPLNPTYDLNTDCRGPDLRICTQSIKSVSDCCMGFGTNCRSDQKPQSTFCDNFMQQQCLVNPTSPHCTCITPIPKDVQTKYNITAGQECWYSPCVDNIKGTDQTQRSYMTSAQYQKFNSKACPAINIVDCSQVGNTVFSKGMNFVNANNQNCSITGAGDGTVIKDREDGTTPPVNDTKKKYLLYGGIGVAVFMVVMMMVLAMSE
jgi:hypothetical protein